MDKLGEFTEFLKTVDLERYRKRTSHIRFFEMNLPKGIQAISLLYQVYWIERKFISFEDFYQRYLQEHKEKLEAFRKETTLCEPDFYRGLEARTYRTWAGLITQIHAGYVAEKVFGVGNVKMSSELDHAGADIRVEYKNHNLNYQIKKTSFAGVRSPTPLPRKATLDGKNMGVFYEVPNSAIFKNPKRKDGTNRKAFQRFNENPKIKRLDNGFIIFTDYVFKIEKNVIDASG